MDSINEGCYKEMLKYLKKREEFFQKEINQLRKKEQLLAKRLEKLDPPVMAPPPIPKAAEKKTRGKPSKQTEKKGKKLTKEQEEELKKKQ